MPDELKNSRDFPKIFYCRHMFPGICGYDSETIFIDADAMKNMNPSFAGKPVYVGHQRVDVDKIQEQADGYVTESFYNELDGWSWAKFIAVSDKANDAISQGWAVSNAYVPSEFAAGGQHHAVDFDRKIVNAIYTHLAIVPDPRYEGAKIFTPEDYKAYCASKKQQLDELKNSKGATKMFKRLFKNKQEEVTTIDDDTMIELQNGKTVSMKDMVDAVTAADEKKNAKSKKNEKDEGAKEEEKGDKEKLNADTEVDVGGQKMPLGHLMNKYMNVQKENAAEEEEKKKKEETEKKNADEKKKEEEEKANSKTFEEMKNAKNTNSSFVQVDTSMDQLARGQSRYGSVSETK